MNAVYLFGVWPLALVMVLLTGRVKRPLVRWMSILVPPLCVLSLWWIPYARSTMHFVWGPPLIAAAVSVLIVLARACTLVYEWRRNSRQSNRLALVGLVRPVMVVLIMIGLLARERIAFETIQADAIAIARQIQETCEATGQCPRTLDGWDIVEENPTLRGSTHVVTRMGRHAVARYDSILSANQFRLTVNCSGILFLSFHGGPEESLHASVNGSPINITHTDDG